MYSDAVTKSVKNDRIYSLSIVKQIDWQFPEKKRTQEVSRPDEETLKRLNEMAKRRPFSTYFKSRKYEML